MRAAFVIAKREFLERVQTKWFAAMTVLGPLLMIALIVVPVLLASHGTDGAKVEITDETGVLGGRLVKAFADDEQHWVATIVPTATTDQELLAKLAKKQISGFLRIPKDALTRSDGIKVKFEEARSIPLPDSELRVTTRALKKGLVVKAPKRTWKKPEAAKA